MVACKDHTRYPSDRYPTSGLQCLGGLVDKQCAELLSVEQPTAAAYECTGDDSGFVEELGIDTELQFGGTFLQAFQFLVVFIIPSFPMGPQVADGLTDSPQLVVVGMSLETTFVCKGEHLVVHLRGIADTEHIHSSVHEFLRDPVYGHIALRAHQHLILTAQRLVDGLHERCRLARTRRTVYDGHVLCPQHLVHGLFLRRIQIGELHGAEAECLGLLVRIEEVAQIA